jgi:general stress protein 26
MTKGNESLSKEVIIKDLREGTEVTVSTHAGEYIRNRMMHYAVTDDFIFYLASMKGDPKIFHITNNPTINLIVLRKKGDPNNYMELNEFAKWSEAEILGAAEVVKDDRERQYALKLLYNRSPVVKFLTDNKQDSLLEVIKVSPHQIRYKTVSDILRGKPPVILEFRERKNKFEEFDLLKKKLKIWYSAIRAPFLVAGIPSAILGALIAYNNTGLFNLSLFILTLVGVIIGHISVNLLNDYYDHKLETDVRNRSFIRPFSGGSRVLQMGLLSPLEVLSAGLASLTIFFLIGLYISLVRGLVIILLGLIGILSIYAYNTPPLRLSGRGLGELLVGINFGILIT